MVAVGKYNRPTLVPRVRQMMNSDGQFIELMEKSSEIVFCHIQTRERVMTITISNLYGEHTDQQSPQVLRLGFQNSYVI